MEISVKTFIVNVPDCWNGGGFRCCQYLGQAFRAKTNSNYFKCQLFNVFLIPEANKGNPIKPCVACMDARYETEKLNRK
jgi:hypothetical protein